MRQIRLGYLVVAVTEIRHKQNGFHLHAELPVVSVLRELSTILIYFQLTVNGICNFL